MAGEDPAYMEYLRGLPCRVCGGRVGHPHHKMGAGMALRSHDREAINLCGDGSRGCHGALHGLSGPFKGWDKARRRAWEAAAVFELQEDYDASF